MYVCMIRNRTRKSEVGIEIVLFPLYYFTLYNTSIFRHNRNFKEIFCK